MKELVDNDLLVNSGPLLYWAVTQSEPCHAYSPSLKNFLLLSLLSHVYMSTHETNTILTP